MSHLDMSGVEWGLRYLPKTVASVARCRLVQPRESGSVEKIADRLAKPWYGYLHVRASVHCAQQEAMRLSCNSGNRDRQSE